MVRTSTTQHLRTAAVAALLLLLGAATSARASVQQHFNPGSLIIPMEAPFQNPCGVVSAYGLVYKALQASQALYDLNGSRISVHWVYKGDKKSPNRCVPTNLQKTPTTPTTCPAPYSDTTKCNPLPIKDPNWNDGCDFSVTSQLTAVTAPVTMVDNSSQKAGGDDLQPSGSSCGSLKGQFCTRDTFNNSLDASLSYPNFTSVIVQHSSTPSQNVTTVQYMGGAFVINATDAPLFLALLSGATKVPDRFNHTIDFSVFANKADIGQCSYGKEKVTGATVFTNGYADHHWVNIHRAQQGFDAYDSQVMNEPPGKIALLQTAGGQAGVGTNGVIGDMLPNYLKSAGLDFTGAQGCPQGGYDSKLAKPNTVCPTDTAGNVLQGYIFDSFDVMDLQDSTFLNQQFTDSHGVTKPIYQNFWTPHWEGTTFTGCDKTCINTARQTIKTFTSSRRVGLLAECGSIAVIEGAQGANSFDSGAPDDIQFGSPAAGWWYPPKQLVGSVYQDPATGFVNVPPLANAGEPPTRLMTCVESPAGSGKCAAADTGTAGMRGTLHDIDPKGPTSNTSNYSILGKGPLRNCTDPDLTVGSNCMYFGMPGSAYAQIGDYLWISRYGLLSNFKPNSGSVYRSNVGALGFTIANIRKPGPTLDYATARPLAMADDFDLMTQGDTTTGTSNPSDILYLGGHSYSGDVSGTRVVLNTMLALGQSFDHVTTGDTGATEYNGMAFVGTYERVTSPGAPSQWQTFTPSLEEQWRFPYHMGDMQAHIVNGGGALNRNAASNYTDATAWNGADAAHLPLPAARNVFTYLGGTVSTTVSTKAGAPNGVLQSGWTPVDVDYDSVDPSNAKCVDKFHIGEINSKTKPNYTNPNTYAGMLPGADGVCDLQEAFELSRVDPYFADDHGTANGVSGGSIPAQFQTDLLNAKEFAQMVRGFCYSTDASGGFVSHPADSVSFIGPFPANTCNSYKDGIHTLQNDIAELGGFVHSQPAIVPASPYIADYPAGTHRPTVAYVGGLDGQLHAFYVPSDHLDLGYQRPFNVDQTGAVPSLNADASGTFAGHTPYGSFTYGDSNAFQELWSFIPPGQLPLLQSNNAEVDSSPVVIDAYGDFDGSGVRAWHTVLVASAGGGNREVFALDVTNPLRPALLWDLQASFQDGIQYAPAPLTDDDTGLNTATQAQAFAWQNGCHADAIAHGTCTSSKYKLPPAATPNVTGLYNYANLGASQSISIAQMRRFNAPVFAAFVATNEPQNKVDSGAGLYVFAIDVTNGQKIWEFNNPYDLADDPADQKLAAQGNSPPAGVTLLSKAGTSLIDTAYVGDDEGALWELDAADGVNVNSFAPFLTDDQYATLCSSSTGKQKKCNFALSEAYGSGTHGPQPISSLSTIFILPQLSPIGSLPTTSPLKDYAGQPMLAYGTGGTDTVSGMEPVDPSGAACKDPACIDGYVHLIPLLPASHYAAIDLVANSSLGSTLDAFGVVKKEPPNYPTVLPNGQRVYGSIVAAGDQLFFNATSGSAAQIDQRGNLGGTTYGLFLSSANPSLLYDYGKGAGLTGVGGAGGTPMLDTTTGTVVVVTDKKIVTFAPPPGQGGTLSGATVNGRGATPTGLLSWFFRRRGLEY